MKKLFSLLLAAAMILSLAACGSKDDKTQPESALDLLNTVWSQYGDDKFPAVGGDMNDGNMVEDAPGSFSIEDSDALDRTLGYPAADADKLAGAASLIHMMNANTFTAGAFRLNDSSDMDAVVSDLKDNIMSRQWMCGFPDKLVIVTYGDYIVSCFGAEDLVDQFRDAMTAAFDGASVACDGAIA